VLLQKNAPHTEMEKKTKMYLSVKDKKKIPLRAQLRTVFSTTQKIRLPLSTHSAEN
jgi:hypothetical protein